jgi:class 3 adenylate cyclase
MVSKTELTDYIQRAIDDAWASDDGRAVPATKDISLGNKVRRFELATFLYADLNGSTKMVETLSWQRCAEIYKTYLYCASRMIRHFGGEVVAFDGDRVMGVFLGGAQSTSAVRCALRINWALIYLVQPAYNGRYGTGFTIGHSMGIDASEVRCCRTGVRGDNDLLWIGSAPNIAAKLTAMTEYTTWITDTVYKRMPDEVKVYDGRHIWEECNWTSQNNRVVYRSNWYWPL